MQNLKWTWSWKTISEDFLKEKIFILTTFCRKNRGRNREEHFKPIELFGGEEGFKQTQLRDGIKNEYCQAKDIPLLRIPYWEFDQIESLVIDFLQLISPST